MLAHAGAATQACCSPTRRRQRAYSLANRCRARGPRALAGAALRSRYAAHAVALFLIELAIALFVHDDFVRPYVGDVLVVPLVYFVVMAVYPGRTLRVLIGVFVFACLVELAQLAQVVDRLHIENTALRVIIGTTFAVEDIVAYAVGALLTYAYERAASQAKLRAG